MACGNNMVSRSGLQSAPVAVSMPSYVKREAATGAAGDQQGERVAEAARREAELLSRFQAAGRLQTVLLGVPAHLAAKTATPAERKLAEGYAQVAGKPRNNQYAGQGFPLAERYPELAAKYSDSVQFDEQGFPDFSPYAVAIVELGRLPGELRETRDGKFTWDREADFKAADAKSGWDDKRREDEGYVWHHHQDGKTMLLVPKDLHEKVGHTGGVAHEMNAAGPQRLITNYLLNSMQELLDDEE